MTGRDGGANLAPLGEFDPVIILVRPQLAENIGTTARAMANGGLFHLRLVAPRDGWPQLRAWNASSGAYRILEEAKVFGTVDESVADLQRVYATCPRPRHIIKPVLTARSAAAELRIAANRHLKCGILFGPERAGLDNEDMARTDTLIRYPLNPDFMSLNLAQAVLVMAYEWYLTQHIADERQFMTNETRIATKGELHNFMEHLLRELEETGFLRNEQKKPGMIRNLRHLFTRGEITEQELRTLHGVVRDLARGRKREKKADSL